MCVSSEVLVKYVRRVYDECVMCETFVTCDSCVMCVIAMQRVTRA